MAGSNLFPDAPSGGYQGAYPIATVLHKTYLLLAATLLFSTFTAVIGMRMAFAYQHPIMIMIAAFISLFAVQWTGGRNSPMAVPLVFLFTGLMGLSLGPVIAMYLQTPAGPAIVAEALLGTAVIFGSLSIYALVSRRNFSFMGGFLMTGLVIVVLASLANLFFHLAGLQLVIAGMALIVFSGLVLFDTSRMVNGGETRPVIIAVGLYLDVLNLFMALLEILGALQGGRRR
ncbi:Bax inhibitor-1 family protein [Acidiferrobacter sp.]|uniref:Bax inhibitor-1 family protein n=1 Tax=Acidiferrobacter sp. TaxID=1872107 RepID=UPI002633FE3D|nr:Bax inhibitor-1 family protein [Acidiferrobacter sp.]